MDNSPIQNRDQQEFAISLRDFLTDVEIEQRIRHTGFNPIVSHLNAYTLACAFDSHYGMVTPSSNNGSLNFNYLIGENFATSPTNFKWQDSDNHLLSLYIERIDAALSEYAATKSFT